MRTPTKVGEINRAADDCFWRDSMRFIAAVAAALSTAISSASGAQFAPSGAVADPNNPSSATITKIVDPYKRVDHYYYDCRKRKWIWVARNWYEKGNFSSVYSPIGSPAPTAAGVAAYESPTDKERSASSPPGSEISAGDPNRAFNPTTGENFVWTDKGWMQTKTGKIMPAPNLCPCPEPKTMPPPQQPATPPPTNPPQQPKLDKTSSRILDLQNGERFALGLPPLRWNFQLELSATAWAQEMARTGQEIHAPREGRGVERENLQKGLIGWGPDRMVQDWIGEKRNFRSGIYPEVCVGEWTLCAHYTQIIWPTTTDIGCGEATGSGFQWLVCRYSPGGNRPGTYVGRTPERG